MADQSVRITELPDNSAYRVAFDLWIQLRYHDGQRQSVEQDLELFLRCRRAVLRGALAD